jgi:hypothetical protein
MLLLTPVVAAKKVRGRNKDKDTVAARVQPVHACHDIHIEVLHIRKIMNRNVVDTSHNV